MLRLGILSTARINQKLLAGAAGANGVEVVAVASRDGRRAEAYARDHEIPVAHASYEALLSDENVDAVYVPLPNALHVPWTIRALEAGKHVLCEKPMSREPAEVERTFDVAEHQRRVLFEAFMWRHNPQTRRLHQLVREGAIGQLRIVRAAFSFRLTDPANIRLSAELAGGALMDVGCYCVSAARLLAGEPRSVTAQQVTGGDGVEATLVGTLAFDDDVLGYLDCSLQVPARSALEVIGTDGVLWVSDPWHCVGPGIELRRTDGTVERIEVERLDSYQLELEDLAAAAAGQRTPLLGREDAVGQARTIDALLRSAAGEGTVRVG
jgi:xylose dehydrogenase (NAD/NADP)